MARKIESLFIPGPAGRLEALLEEPDEGDPREAVLVCHPHPQHGGTMHNKVVYRIARGFRRQGAVVLRFNYRGVNLSEGVYDQGRGEAQDARAALALLRQRYPNLDYTLAGFSFGSRIVLEIGAESPGPRQVVAVGFPASHPDGRDYTHSLTPRVFLHSPNDQFGPRAVMQPFFDSLTGDKRLVWVDSNDHFFSNALDAFEQAVAGLRAT